MSTACSQSVLQQPLKMPPVYGHHSWVIASTHTESGPCCATYAAIASSSCATGWWPVTRTAAGVWPPVHCGAVPLALLYG